MTEHTQEDTEESGPSVPAVTKTAVFDPDTALRQTGGDAELLREVICLFQGEAPKWLTEICAALDDGDLPAAERTAHRLKGAAGSLAAANVWETAQRLELHCRAGEPEEAAGAFASLGSETDRLRVALETFIQAAAA